MWNYKTPGIPDEYFERTENVPITKEEVRTIQISKARLKPGQTVYDIGCGSGSISIEAAFQVESSGKILAIDYDENAIELTKKNMEKFGLSNISVIFGNAKEKILELEEADAIFIGGTGGDTKEIVEISQNKHCKKIIKKTLQPIFSQQSIDTVTLSSTHLPFLKSLLEKEYPHIQFINPGNIIAQKVYTKIKHNQSKRNSLKIFTSGEIKKFQRKLNKIGIKNKVSSLSI